MAKKIGGDADRGKRTRQSGRGVQHGDRPVENLSQDDSDIDAASADSFPASDPPSFTSVTRTGKPKQRPDRAGRR